MAAPALSIVTMLYRSEPYVREFYARMSTAAAAAAADYELIFVDDGSPDAAAAVVRELLAHDPHLALLDLSRNFGHHQAAVAGLRHARGERVFIIDVDLEERPEWLLEFVAEQQHSGADVVYGVAAARHGGLLKKHVGSLFWKIFNVLSDVQVPLNPCTVRLMSRRYVEALLTLPERNLFLAGNYAWLGFRQVGRTVEKGLRPTRSSYSPVRLARLFVDAITSFSSYPLRVIFVVGVGLALGAAVASAGLVTLKLVRPESISLGWPSLVLSIWFLGGVNIAFLGVIGIYLSKIFNETKGRPLYVVRGVERGTRADSGSDGA
jgi:putative glycosyltransferase